MRVSKAKRCGDWVPKSQSVKSTYLQQSGWHAAADVFEWLFNCRSCGVGRFCLRCISESCCGFLLYCEFTLFAAAVIVFVVIAMHL